jgi:translation initiation factor 1
MSKRPRVTPDATPLRSSPFASILPALADVPDGPPPPLEPEPAPTPKSTADLRGRLVVRRQKRGQGGKTVTCVEGLPSELAPEMLARLKQDLGCNGRIDDAILVAGTSDHARVAKWLRDAGATRVVLGN